MKPVIHQSLGNITGVYPGALSEPSGVDDELMRRTSCTSCIEYRVVRFQAGFQIVGIEDGDLCHPGEPLRSQHADVGVRDRKDARTAPRSCRYRWNSAFTACSHERVGRQVWSQLVVDSYGTHSRSAATMRDTEGLVQVQMADIGADFGWRCEADLCIEVGTIHVDEPPIVVDQVADFTDLLFKDSVG